MSTSHTAEAESSQMLSCTLPEFRKRSLEHSNGSPEEESKRSKYLYHFVLASESEQPTDEDSESVHSIQTQETDYAKDTTDTSSHDEWSANSVTMEVEYEVAASSDNYNPFDDNIHSSSGTDELVCAANVIAAAIKDDVGLWADHSESDSGPTYDPQVPHNYWTCVQCKCRNNNPRFRYCEKCFRLKKDIFPPRPRHKRRRKASGALSPETADKRSSTPTEERSSPTPTEERTSPTPAGEACSLPANEVIEPAIVRPCLGITTDSGYNNSQRGDGPLSSELCIICNVKPKNGIFVHKKISHICCCYGCAVKVWNKSGKCPLCSQTPKQISKAFW